MGPITQRHTLSSRKVNKVEERFLWLIQAIRVGCVKGEKTQFDSLQFQLSNPCKENKGRRKKRRRKKRRNGRFEANRSKLRFGNLTLFVYVYVHIKLVMMLN